MLHKRFLKRLREIREAKGLTQTVLAERLDMKQPTYCAIERGENSPTLSTVEKIAKALGVDSSDLLEEKILV